MPSLLHPVRLGLITLAVCTGLAATAQAADPGPHDEPGARAEHHRMGEHGKFFSHHLEKLHDQLKLTAAQEPQWVALTEKLKPAEPGERPDFEALSKLPTPERLDRMLALHQAHLKHMEARNAAIKSFYAGLSAEQKKTFDDRFMPGHRHQGEGHHGDKPHHE